MTEKMLTKIIEEIKIIEFEAFTEIETVEYF